MLWLRDDFPYWFQHLTLGVAAFESQTDDGNGDEKSENQTGLVTVPVGAFTNMVLFWVLNSPSSLRGQKLCFFYVSILAANKYNSDYTHWFDQWYVYMHLLEYDLLFEIRPNTFLIGVNS